MIDETETDTEMVHLSRHEEEPLHSLGQLLSMIRVSNEVAPDLRDALEVVDELGRDAREDLHQGSSMRVATAPSLVLEHSMPPRVIYGMGVEI